MAVVSGAQVIAKVLKEEAVEGMFGIYGDELMPILHCAGERGIRIYHMRHEQSGAFAADGYARGLGRPGVCFGGGSPGYTNMVSPISHAQKAMSPVVAIVGQQALAMDKLNPEQEGYPTEIFGSITKWSHLVSDWHMITFWIRKAFRDAMTYPPGPVLLSFPANVTLARGDEDKQLKNAPWPEVGKTQGAPNLVENAVEMLLKAERPLVVGGDGIFWSNASAELKEFVELLQVPVHTRRMGRGAVPEDHRLAVTAGQRQPLLDNADVVLLLGLHASYLEEWFEPPIWNDKAKYIQIHEAPEAFFITPPTEIAIAGNPKLVLKQMIDCAKDLKRETSKWASWLQFMDETKQRVDKGLKDRLEQWRERKPIHPELLAQEILDIMDDDATIVPDSLSLSGMVTGRIKAKFAGQILDAGLHQSVGHGPGIACGAQLARPGKQVILLLGDGGMGVGGMDIETLRRYNLPVIIIQYTNSAWAGRSVSRELFWWKSDPWNMVPGIRYDKMFDAVGCHGEHVEDPKEIRPALERALNSGITSVVNVVGETHAAHPLTRRMAMRSIWSLGNVDELPDEGKAEMQRLSPREVGRIQKILLDYGLEVPLEELMQITGRSIEEAKGEKK